MPTVIGRAARGKADATPDDLDGVVAGDLSGQNAATEFLVDLVRLSPGQTMPEHRTGELVLDVDRSCGRSQLFDRTRGSRLDAMVCRGHRI
jgi:hypothetical protein